MHLYVNLKDLQTLISLIQEERRVVERILNILSTITDVSVDIVNRNKYFYENEMENIFCRENILNETYRKIKEYNNWVENELDKAYVINSIASEERIL